MPGRLLPAPSVASGGSITARGMCQNTSPGDHSKPSRLLQCAALRHQRQYTFRRLQSIQKVATNFLTGVADATKSHSVLSSSLASDEAAGPLQVGHSRLQVAARASSIVSGRRLQTDRGPTPDAPSFTPLTPTFSLFREQTLDLATGVSRLRVREFGTVYLLTAAA